MKWLLIERQPSVKERLTTNDCNQRVDANLLDEREYHAQERYLNIVKVVGSKDKM